jgi:hypothetical protein
MSTSLVTAPIAETAQTETTELWNPFLQFVDPRRYHELVELANKRAVPSRYVCPLSHPDPTRTLSERASASRGR